MRFGDKLKRNFAKNLQTLRTRNNLTQAKLVDELNEKYKSHDIELQRTSIVNYEAEGAMPRIDALFCIAQHFGKTIDEIISPAMDRPAFLSPWMIQERSLESGVQREREPWNRGAHAGDFGKSTARSSDLNLDAILTTCVDSLAHRQFHIELLKKLYQLLLKEAKNEEDLERLGTMFHKTYLGCVISKSKYLQELAETMLNEQERSVFMAFQDADTTTNLVAKALEMTDEEVVAVFISAQTKMSSITEGKSKSNLT